MPGEQKSDQDAQTMWDHVAKSKEFRDLMAARKIFIIPAFIFF